MIFPDLIKISSLRCYIKIWTPILENLRSKVIIRPIIWSVRRISCFQISLSLISSEKILHFAAAENTVHKLGVLFTRLSLIITDLEKIKVAGHQRVLETSLNLISDQYEACTVVLIPMATTPQVQSNTTQPTPAEPHHTQTPAMTTVYPMSISNQ